MNNRANLAGRSGLIHTFSTMKNAAFLLSIGLLLIGLQACEIAKCGPTKDNFLDKYDAFITKIDRLDMEVDDDRWQRHDETFRSYVDECYDYHEEELSTKEKRQFWMKSLKYYSIRYGEGMINELSNDDITSQRIRDNVEDVLQETGRDIEDFVQKSSDELEELFEDIGNDIERWAEKLKEILEE